MDNTDNNSSDNPNAWGTPQQDTTTENIINNSEVTGKGDSNSPANTVWKNPNIIENDSNTGNGNTNFNSNRQTVKFRVSDAIKFAWKESIANLGNLFLIIIIFVIVQIIINIILGTLLKTSVHTVTPNCFGGIGPEPTTCSITPINTTTPTYIINRIIFYMIDFIIGAIFTVGMYKVSVDIYNGGKASLKVFFDIKNIILKFIAGEVIALIFLGLLDLLFIVLVTGIVVTSVVSHQFLLLIILIPILLALIFFEVYMICSYYLWPLPIIANDSTIIRSFKESFKVTRGNVGNIFWLGLLLVFINIAGVICLLVGLVVTIPMMYLAFTYTYFTLKQNNS